MSDSLKILTEIEDHFQNLTTEQFEQNLVKAGQILESPSEEKFKVLHLKGRCVDCSFLDPEDGYFGFCNYRGENVNYDDACSKYIKP